MTTAYRFATGAHAVLEAQEMRKRYTSRLGREPNTVDELGQLVSYYFGGRPFQGAELAPLHFLKDSRELFDRLIDGPDAGHERAAEAVHVLARAFDLLDKSKQNDLISLDHVKALQDVMLRRGVLDSRYVGILSATLSGRVEAEPVLGRDLIECLCTHAGMQLRYGDVDGADLTRRLVMQACKDVTYPVLGSPAYLAYQAAILIVATTASTPGRETGMDGTAVARQIAQLASDFTFGTATETERRNGTGEIEFFIAASWESVFLVAGARRALEQLGLAPNPYIELLYEGASRGNLSQVSPLDTQNVVLLGEPAPSARELGL